jgi:RHS repeat-associated protein
MTTQSEAREVASEDQGHERRSYDAFGVRRNPQWGKPPAAPQASNVNMGFTGHEPDELGLVNMKGRIYDPKLGRFLMTDPLVSRPFFSQSWNAYSYVLNNPLKYVDPSGFEEEEKKQAREELSSRGSYITDTGTTGYTEVWTYTYGANGGGGYPADNVKPASTGPSAPGDGASEAGPIGAVDDTSVKNHPLDPQGAPEKGRVRTVAERALVEVVSWGCLASVCRPTGEPDNDISRQIQERREELVQRYPGGLPILVVSGGAPAPAPVTPAPAAPARPVVAGEAGAYGNLKARSVVGDSLEVHHMPQAAQGFTTRNEGGALAMEAAEHAKTRTFRGKGSVTKQSEAGLPFRTVLARDIRDVRGIFGSKYDGGLRELLKYYHKNFPALIKP